MIAVNRMLVIDDDPSLLRAVQIGFTARGYEVHIARTGDEGISQTALVEPNVILLDLGLPDLGGLEVCRRIRSWSQIPIIVLSAAGDEVMKVAALDGGADDYVTKPFGMAELEARVRVALRHGLVRSQDTQPTVLSVGNLTIDIARRSVASSDREIDLTAKEFDLLAFLAVNVGRVCTHRMILREVWGPSYGSELHYLRVYANRLRRKLSDTDGVVLHTKAGIGYQLVESPLE